MLFLVKKEAKMPIKKKNNQPAKVSLRKRLLAAPIHLKNWCYGWLLEVQFLMAKGKKEQNKIFKKNLTVKKKK